MKSKLFDLLKACKTSQFESAAEDLADALWLMQVIDQKKSKTPQPISTDQVKEEFKDPLSHPDATHSSSPSPANIETKPPPEKSTSKSTNQLDLHIPKQERSSVGFIKTPVPDSLPHKQEIRRAFSILRKAFVAGFSQEVDEERTTKRISDELIWEPIMQLSKERNLNLALVVDQSISMIVWQDTAKEFHKLLATLGAFRKITPWKIETEKEEPILSLGLSYSKKRRARKISELLTTSEKQIVIILTDSISAAWHNGNMAKVVDVWSKTNQVAIINFLPEFLWSRTGLNRAKKVLLSAPYQIALNANLKCSEIDFLSTTDLKNLDKQLFSSPIPVATIAPYSLTSLSRLVVGYGNSQVLGFFLKKKVESVPKTVIGSSLSPEEVVKRFHSLVSPAARQLARYLAASPVINLQIVRILRSKMISHSFEAGTITEAEVLLNGLFKVSESITETTPSKIEFEFREGVREYLLAALTLTDVIQVLEEVSDYITEHLGNLDLETFKLMLTNPGKALEEIEGKSLDKIVATSPVARITADILHRLGGNYTKLAKTLTETPTIPSNLRTYTFTTVKVNKLGQITKKWQAKANYYEEDLGNGIVLEMVQIPGGTFLMGSKEGEGYKDESRQHEVTVPSFYMGKYQVTQEQWKAMIANNPSRFKGDRLPVEMIRWEQAKEFCKKLSEKTGKEYRLPSEAEWEYACRAGTNTPFAFGETITPEIVNYNGNYPYADAPKGQFRGKTVEVGSLGVANQFGLYDMHGNVWEWCEDVWHDNYNGAPRDGSVWVTGGDASKHIVRGGSWYNYSNNCRSAQRNRWYGAGNLIGFRVVVLSQTL